MMKLLDTGGPAALLRIVLRTFRAAWKRSWLRYGATDAKGTPRHIWFLLPVGGLILTFGHADGQQAPAPAAENPYLKGSEGYDKGPRGLTSYQPIAIDQPFAARMARDVAAKSGIEREHQALLEQRYDLSDRSAQGVTMDRGKLLQEGVRVRLPAGTSWEQLAAMTPDEIRERGLWPKGFLPLPHPIHSTGGFVFPQNVIDATKRQDGRDLTRFDIGFDLPERFLAEFPPAMYLVQRPDLGDVSQGQLISLANYFEMFNGILTPRQLEGLRLLLTPFPQQQFNATDDRKSALASQGASCFDCHSNGHQNGATHLAPDARPEWFRHRIKTISLRGINIQRLFGSQRALKTVEDFTEFEQRTAYFDGDIVTATKKGVNPLERGSQVDFMADFQEMLDFPPAPKLDLFGKLDPAKATQAEMRGQRIFFGKGKCDSCHQPPYYTDNLMHDLKTERFFKPELVHSAMEVGDGSIKTFALRGVKDNPPYLHDERLLTLDDTVEFFNLVLADKLTRQEKQDLVAFLRAL
jgi:cytochrome c peroxidase